MVPGRSESSVIGVAASGTSPFSLLWLWPIVAVDEGFTVGFSSTGESGGGGMLVPAVRESRGVRRGRSNLPFERSRGAEEGAGLTAMINTDC
jgi:hypothetical protein